MPTGSFAPSARDLAAVESAQRELIAADPALHRRLMAYLAARDPASAHLGVGLALLAGGAPEDRALAEALEVKRDLILERYTRRLEVVREGIMALARGEDPDAFRRRFDKIGQ